MPITAAENTPFLAQLAAMPFEPIAVGAAIAALAAFATRCFHAPLAIAALALVAALVASGTAAPGDPIIVTGLSLAFAVYIVGDSVEKRRARDESTRIAEHLSELVQDVDGFCSALERRARELDERASHQSDS